MGRNFVHFTYFINEGYKKSSKMPSFKDNTPWWYISISQYSAEKKHFDHFMKRIKWSMHISEHTVLPVNLNVLNI